MAQDSQSRHFLIGHSHGGNVALYALKHLKEKDPAVAKRVLGVVTVATPFLIARKRVLGKPIEHIPHYLPILLMIGAAWWIHLQVDFSWLGFVVFAVALIVAIMLIMRLAKWWTRFGNRVWEAMRFELPQRDQLLILRSPGDEASVALLVTRAVLSIGMIAFALATRIVAGVERLLERAAARRGDVGVALILAGAGAVALICYLGWGTIGLRRVLCLFAFFLLVFPFLVAVLGGKLEHAGVYWQWTLSVALVTFAVLPSLFMFRYGWQIAVANVWLDVSAEATPLGEWTVVTFPPAKSIGDPGAALMTHSALYDDDGAIDKICDWVESIVKAETQVCAG